MRRFDDMAVALAIDAGAVPSAAIGFADTLGAYGAGNAPEEIWVTSLRESGTGSLREALEASGPRVVRWDPALDGRSILTEAPIDVVHPYLSFVGSDARVNIANEDRIGPTIRIMTNDVYAVDFRIRPTAPATASADSTDCIQIIGGDNIYLERGSCSLSVDELLTTDYQTGRVTFNNMLFSSPVKSGHSSGAHAYGPYIEGLGNEASSVWFHRCLFHSLLLRGPLINTSGPVVLWECWFANMADIVLLKPQNGGKTAAEILGCLVEGGPITTASTGLVEASLTGDAAANGEFFAAGNLLRDGIVEQNNSNGATTKVGVSFLGLSGWTTTPEDLKTELPNEVGARPLDALDTLLIEQAESNSGGIPLTSDHLYYAKHGYYHREGRDCFVSATAPSVSDNVIIEGRFKAGNYDGSVMLAGVWDTPAGDQCWIASLSFIGTVRFQGSSTGAYSSPNRVFCETVERFDDGEWHDFRIEVSGTPLDAVITVDGVVQTQAASINEINSLASPAGGGRLSFIKFNSGANGDYDTAVEDIKITVDGGVIRHYTFDRTLIDSGTDGEDATATGADSIWYGLSEADPVIPAASSLVSHYDFSSTLSHNNGSNFTVVNDLAGNSHIQNPTRPSVTTINGLTAALFDSNTEERAMSISNPVAVGDFTMHIVCTFDASDNTEQRALIGEDGSNRLGYYGETDALDQWSLRIEADTDSPSISPEIALDTPVIVTFRREGGTLNVYVDGNLNVTTSCGTDDRTWTYIGGRATTGAPAFQHIGKIGEIQLYDAAEATGGSMLTQIALLATKWGIS